MSDEPAGAALLDVARRALLDEVLPGLEGRPRYVALMVVNAIGIVGREISDADALAAADVRLRASADGSAADLSRAVRLGTRDADPDLHAALSDAAAAAARVWKAQA